MAPHTTITEGPTTHIEARCSCGKTFQFSVSTTGYDKWAAGANIQNVIPELSADLRELLISGTCDDCWKALFPKEEDFQ